MSQFPTRGMTPPPMYNDGSLNSTLRPYLTLPYLLSLTWLAYPILSLLFIVFRLQISSSSAQVAVNDAKDNLLVGCKAAQQAASSAASLPRFMAISTNKQFAAAANDTMAGAQDALLLVLTCMEAIINFIIDIYRSTFLCFLELAIRGGLAILIGAANDISQFVTGSLNAIRTSIQNDVSSFNSVVSSAVNAVNKINPFSPITAPQLSIPSLNDLQNVTLPTTFQDALTKLNASIPSLDQLRASIDSFVDTPFELVKQDINNTFANMSLDPTLLAVPEPSTLTFCDNLDTSVIDDLGHDLLKIAKIGTGILLIIVVLMLLGNSALEWWKWRSLKLNLQRTRLAWMSDPTVQHDSNSAAGAAPSVMLTDHNLLTLHATSLHPLLTRLANKISAMFNLSPSQYTNLQFFFHYIFHPPALACFLIGFFGILSIELQLLAIHPLEARYSDRAAAAVTDFSDTIATSMNSSMYNQSAVYANSINSNITIFQNSINDGLFGWVNGTTTTLNQTLNQFYSDVQNVVNQVFGGTVLAGPANDFIQCIIGSKVDAFENALTFLHDNLHINLPTVNETALVLSPDEVNQVAQPISAAAVGGGNGDDSGGLVGKLINSYVKSLKAERIMFAVFLGLWGLVVLMGLGIVAWHSFVKPALDGRKKRRYENEKDAEFSGSGYPWPAPPDHKEVPTGGQQNEMASFTPTIESDGGFWSSFRNQIGAPPLPSEKRPGPRPFQSSRGKNQSFETFLDSKSSESLNSVGGTRKLRAVGRKSMGREVFLTDEEAQALRAGKSLGRSEVAGGSGPGWFSKAKGLAFGRQSSEDDVITPFELPQPNKSPVRMGPNGKPNLTISTSTSPSQNGRDLPEIETSQMTYPGSAWSVSPNPETPAARRLPWLHNMNAPMKPSLPSKPSLPPPAVIPRAALPPFRAFQTVGDAPISKPMPLSPVFITPRAGLAPPPRRTASGRPRESYQHSPAPTLTPVTFLLDSHQGRHDSRLAPPVPDLPMSPAYDINPFATPFDDPEQAHTPKAI